MWYACSKGNNNERGSLEESIFFRAILSFVMEAENGADTKVTTDRIARPGRLLGHGEAWEAGQRISAALPSICVKGHLYSQSEAREWWSLWSRMR